MGQFNSLTLCFFMYRFFRTFFIGVRVKIKISFLNFSWGDNLNKSFEEMSISTIKPPRWGECMRTRWPGARGSHWVSSKTSIQFRLQFHSTFSFTNDYPTSANDPTKRAHSYVPKSVPQAQGAKCPYSLDLLCLALQYHFTKSSKWFEITSP